MKLEVLVWECRYSDRKPISPVGKTLKSASIEVSVSLEVPKLCTIPFQPVLKQTIT